MENVRKSRARRLLVFLPLIGICLLLALLVIPLSPWGMLTWSTVDLLLHGSRAVSSVDSPDGAFTAYVIENPSIDPPNQALFVERSDGIRFMHVADLAEDVDSIQEILWSPDSRMVVFHSRDYLTATRVSDWQTVRIYLGNEWRRSRPGRDSTFTSGGIRRRVASVDFPETGVFAYRFEDEEKDHAVRMDEVVRS